jgi:hypothetical protein
MATSLCQGLNFAMEMARGKASGGQRQRGRRGAGRIHGLSLSVVGVQAGGEKEVARGGLAPEEIREVGLNDCPPIADGYDGLGASAKSAAGFGGSFFCTHENSGLWSELVDLCQRVVEEALDRRLRPAPLTQGR